MNTHVRVPGLFYLVITLLSGIGLRIQWLFPDWSVFSQKFAIHAHSHLALLGWLFPILLYSLVKRDTQLTSFLRWNIYILHGLIIAMFPAFLLQGYAFYSILFSSLYLIVSYSILWQLRNELELGKNPVKTWAVLFYVASTIGPWLLGGSTVFGQVWMNAWIAWFLHLQFNGWVTFGLLALFFSRIPSPKWLIHVFATGTLFISFSLMLPQNDFQLLKISAVFAGILLTLSSIWLVTIVVKQHQRTTITGFIIQLLLLKSFLLGFSGLEIMQNYIHHIPQARVAFTHTSLLAIASTFLLFYNGLSKKLTLLFSTASWLMVALLWMELFGLYYKTGIPFSIQVPYIILGVVLLGTILPLILKSVTKVTQNPS
ncbi:hypothetical protein EP331_03660 [bacterium]|nr:MAG: hypothetical protein EP331_03660 [bacterium]